MDRSVRATGIMDPTKPDRRRLTPCYNVKSASPSNCFHPQPLIVTLIDCGLSSYEQLKGLRDDRPVSAPHLRCIVELKSRCSTWAETLPAPPHIFFGRDSEKALILDTANHSNGISTRISILGAPGIGKTTVALRILHDPLNAMKYDKRRVFVQCDSVASPDTLLPLIGTAVGTSMQVAAKLRAEVIRRLSEAPTMLVLDNLESSWEPRSLVKAPRRCLQTSLQSIPWLLL